MDCCKLNPLILFLDTNFLFGLLNLHVNPQVDVSAELCDSILKFHLPFKLRYHDATTREMTNTLFYFGGELRRQKWPQNISRAAANWGEWPVTTTAKALEEKQRELEQKDQALREKEASLSRAKEEKLGADEQVRAVVDQALQDKEAKDLATKEAKNLRIAHQRAETTARTLKQTLAIVAGLGLALIFEWVVNSVSPWRWLA